MLVVEGHWATFVPPLRGLSDLMPLVSVVLLVQEEEVVPPL